MQTFAVHQPMSALPPKAGMRSALAYVCFWPKADIRLRRTFVVETIVPEGGLGRRLDDMHRFHRQRGITDNHIPRRRDDEHDYIRWCFNDHATADAFAAQFSGTLILPK
jgi:hypothetical protein